MVALADAARQAFFAYRDYFWATISEDEDRHYPCRCQGEIAARIAPVTGVTRVKDLLAQQGVLKGL